MLEGLATVVPSETHRRTQTLLRILSPSVGSTLKAEDYCKPATVHDAHQYVSAGAILVERPTEVGPHPQQQEVMWVEEVEEVGPHPQQQEVMWVEVAEVGPHPQQQEVMWVEEVEEVGPHPHQQEVMWVEEVAEVGPHPQQQEVMWVEEVEEVGPHPHQQEVMWVEEVAEVGPHPHQQEVTSICNLPSHPSPTSPPVGMEAVERISLQVNQTLHPTILATLVCSRTLTYLTLHCR